MSAPANILIFGASARAAAFSALRAGLSPWCADLFADADLQAVCPVTRLAAGGYPQQFLELIRTDVSGPWMYTGGLENHDGLVQALANQRPLLGNDQPVLRRARSPSFVAELLNGAGIPQPALFAEYPTKLPAQGEGRWLVKPLGGAGGRGIHFLDGAGRAERRAGYLQEYIEGEPCSAVYVGDGRHAHLLGVTAQLVGDPRVRAAPFHYCGSIGPLPLTPECQQAFARLGNVLAAGCGLRGLFGVDCVLADDVPYPVEVNPRYPASVEVLEYALGIEALTLHRLAFDPGEALLARSASEGLANPSLALWAGKAILYAKESLRFPADGPWMHSQRQSFDPRTLPAFADIPPPHESIEVGKPILTLFATADSAAECLGKVGLIAGDVERCLFRP